VAAADVDERGHLTTPISFVVGDAQAFVFNRLATSTGPTTATP